MTYAVFDIGASFYWLLPTAPPWYAASAPARRAAGQRSEALRSQATAESEVRRMMVEYGEFFWRDGWGPLYSVFGGNPLAAMPSLHFATSLMATLLLAEVGPVAGTLGSAYATTLGFALVYLGEHYVVDLLAGAALTGAVRWLAPRAEPALRSAGGAIAALEAYAHAEELKGEVQGHRDGAGRPTRCGAVDVGGGGDAARASHAPPGHRLRRVRGCGHRVSVLRAAQARGSGHDAASHRAGRPVVDRDRRRAGAGSFAGYVVLFRAVFVGMKAREPGTIGWRESYQITMAGLVATRLFATAGAGGIALTAWALRRSGMAPRLVACRMVAFMVVLYVIYAGSLLLDGVGLGTGLLPGGGSFAITIMPAIARRS